MKSTYIKFLNENKPFMAKVLQVPTINIKDPEMVDKKIEELKKEKYDTFFISNQLASFSQDIVQKYAKSEDIKIIILPDKKN